MGIAMKCKWLMLAVALGGVLSAPVYAENRDPLARVEPLLDPRVWLGGLITEDDVGLLFAQLRAAMLAAVEGREPPPVPESLEKRLDTVGGELRLRGLLAGLVLTQAMEQAAREIVRELAPPPRRND